MSKEIVKDDGLVRTFESGANRNSDDGKYDYEGFYNPLVIEAFGKYMHKHRHLSDGSMRDSDNWQKTFGDKHYDVCIKSAWRHFLDIWMEHRGYKSRDGIDEAICGLLFNIQAYYFKILKDRMDKEEQKND